MRSVESVNPQPEEEDEVTQTMASRQAEAVMERIEDVAERAEEGIELDRPRQGLLDRKVERPGPVQENQRSRSVTSEGSQHPEQSNPNTGRKDTPVRSTTGFNTERFRDFCDGAKKVVSDSNIGVANLRMLEGVLTETRYPTNYELNKGLSELMSTIGREGRTTSGKKRPKPRGRMGERRNRGRGRNGDDQTPGGGGRRAAKRVRYGRIQEMYKKSHKLVAQEILDGKVTQKCDIEPKVVEDVYRGRFARKSVEVDLSKYPPPKQLADNGELLDPITGSDVSASVRCMETVQSPGFRYGRIDASVSISIRGERTSLNRTREPTEGPYSLAPGRGRRRPHWQGERLVGRPAPLVPD